MCLLQSQLKITAKDKNALQDVCLFIVTLYTKPWLECAMAVKAPNQDLSFLKAIKEYNKVDATSFKAFISKFIHHFFFDEEVDTKTKKKMINNLW